MGILEPKPKRSIPSTSASFPSSLPTAANVVLIECTRPKRKSCGPGVSPRKLHSRGPVVSMQDGPGKRVSGVTVPGVERDRGGHDLERRARRVEALRAAVQGRRALCGEGLLQVAVDGVRVERRRRRHHEHRAGGGLERDDGAAQPALAQGGQGLALPLPREVQDEVVAADGAPARLVEQVLEAALEVRRWRRSGSRSTPPPGPRGWRRSTSSRPTARPARPAGRCGRRASARSAAHAGCEPGRRRRRSTIVPRSTVSSRNTSRGLACRVARLGAAHTCQ